MAPEELPTPQDSAQLIRGSLPSPGEETLEEGGKNSGQGKAAIQKKVSRDLCSPSCTPPQRTGEEGERVSLAGSESRPFPAWRAPELEKSTTLQVRMA